MMAVSYEMSKEHKDKLRENRVFLLQNILPSQVLLGYLFEKGILSEETKEEIEVEKTKSQKVTKLLDILPRRGPEAFKEFVFGLMMSEQKHVAYKLDTNLTDQHSHEENAEEHQHGDEDLTDQHSSEENAEEHQHGDEEDGYLNPDVIPVNLTESEVQKLINDTNNNYKMSSNPRGRALVVNNTYFVNSARRDGAEYDSCNISSLFKKLHFEVVNHNDLEGEEIKELFKKESQEKHHNNADCFVAFIMSHGSKGYVYGTDGKRVSIEDDIVSRFYHNNCQALADKPKMFFIQACQGEGATVEKEGSPLFKPDQDDVSEDIKQAMKDLNFQDTKETAPHIPDEKSDIVLAYSTVPGQVSYRISTLGSFFIRAIVEVFAKEAHKEDLISLLTKARKKVKKRYASSFKQLTRSDDTTTKKIYFFPGYVRNM